MASGEDRDLVAKVPARLPAARSIADARPGEVIYLDGKGRVVGPRRLTYIKVGAWGFMGLMVGTIGVMYGVWFSPIAGAAASLGMAAIVGFRLRYWPAFRAGMALMASFQWEAAYPALLALEGKTLPSAFRDNLQVALASLEYLLGRPQVALERVERWLARHKHSTSPNRIFPMRWRAASLRANILAHLGRLDEARRQRDELAANFGRAPAPLSDFYQILLQSTNLGIAFDADGPDELPPDETLHEWARAALLRTQFGEMLVSLAWAFHRRGDDDMARHLLAEAPSRTPRSTLPTTAPRLHAWAEERRAAWALAESDPP